MIADTKTHKHTYCRQQNTQTHVIADNKTHTLTYVLPPGLADRRGGGALRVAHRGPGALVVVVVVVIGLKHFIRKD